MPKYSIYIYTAAERAYAELRASSPGKALARARAMADDERFALDFESFEDLGPVKEIEVCDEAGHEVANWLSPHARLQIAAPSLLKAARLVVSRWSEGDLADAVRQLEAAIAEADVPD